MKFTVTNIFTGSGETTHRKVETALKAKDGREGSGWIVLDSNGNEWGVDFDGNPVIVFDGHKFFDIIHECSINPGRTLI